MLLLLLPLLLWAQKDEYFESKVKPILRTQCWACHTVNSLNSGLALDSREAIVRGGNRGANPKLIVDAVKRAGELKMPPTKPLTLEQVATLEAWVAKDLPVSADFVKAKRRSSKHWVFQPVRRPEAPVTTTAWGTNTIDKFILAKLEEAKLTPSAEAARATLARRVSLDLIGLPPTEAELKAFLQDSRADAYDKLVDRLLASPHYGERQARLWLDLARYADTDGYTIDAPRDIYPWRDWVIHAYNEDKPFDRFTIEQFAGDLLPGATNDNLIATGFHRNTPTNQEGGIDFEQYRVEATADRVASTGAGWLGLTVGCARCHDHKYDPISQRDYYQLFAFFNNIDEIDKEADRKFFNRPFLSIGEPKDVAALTEWDAKIESMESVIRKHIESLNGEVDKDPKLLDLQKEIERTRTNKPKVQRTMILRERATPRESYIHLGGDFTRKGSKVEAAVPSVLPPLKGAASPPTRLDFARWLVDRDNPLTARVVMNRTWQQYFGKGIVETESDFGVTGDKPTHPELLDWLAMEFMDGGWQMKRMHKLIVMSATYRQASANRPEATAVDPNNKLLARQNRLRLDAELIRDSSLVAAGLLNAKVGGASVYPPLPKGANDVTQVKREWKTATGEDRYRRGMYTYFQRSAAHPALITFDAPDTSAACTRRIRSNTPLQALILLNDEAYAEFAEALAKRVIAGAGTEDARIEQAWTWALNRQPKPAEKQRLVAFLEAERSAKPAATQQQIWTAAARVILNLDAFLTRD